MHGLGIALGSEIFKLTETERDQVARTVIRRVGGRVPVVVNTGADGTDLAIAHSRAAEAAGADALMVILPQAPIGPGLALRIADACRNVRAIKVGTPPVTTRVAETVAVASDRVDHQDRTG